MEENDSQKHSYTKWAHDRKYAFLLVGMLSFGAYWMAMLLRMIVLSESPEERRRRAGDKEREDWVVVAGLTRKERRAVADVLFPLFLAAMATGVFSVWPWFPI